MCRGDAPKLAPLPRPAGGREVKVVAVTAFGYASRRNEILAEGFDDYIRKPYRPAEILACMARHFGVRDRDAEAPDKIREAGAQRSEIWLPFRSSCAGNSARP